MQNSQAYAKTQQRMQQVMKPLHFTAGRGGKKAKDVPRQKEIVPDLIEPADAPNPILRVLLATA